MKINFKLFSVKRTVNFVKISKLLKTKIIAS